MFKRFFTLKYEVKSVLFIGAWLTNPPAKRTPLRPVKMILTNGRQLRQPTSGALTVILDIRKVKKCR